MNEVRIENWAMVGLYPYAPPEQQVFCLEGELYGHPRVTDGHRTTTTEIVGVDGEVILTNSGSRYVLGEPDPPYEAMYPGAKERLIERLHDKEAGYIKSNCFSGKENVS